MTPALAPAPDLESMEQLAADIQRRWTEGEPPDAAAALAAHPELKAHKPLVLELAYEEFCLRTERRQTLEPKKFADQFPFAESVARLLAVHSVIGRQSFGSLGSSSRPVVRLAPGDTVDGRVVVRRFGRGGFADVYLVKSPQLGWQAAVLKVSNRGEHEAHTLGRLKHKHVMEVTHVVRVGECRGMFSPFLGLATGETLVERAKGVTPSAAWLLGVVGELPPGDPPFAARSDFPITDAMPYPRAVLHITAAVADTLAYVHGEGLSHRDLKPSNLLIGPTGYPYLLDFNLADDGRSGRVGGTIAYAAPEVLAVLTAGSSVGGNTLDWPAADVFSLAVLAFELLLLEHPYLKGAALDHIDGGTVARAAASARVKLAAIWLPLPKAARQLLLDCLHPNPTARPTAARLAHGLAAALAPRRPAWAWVTAAAIAVALGGGGLAWALRPEPTPTPADPDPIPTDPFARGVWFVRHGQHDAAIPSFKTATETDTTGRAWEWLGYCHCHLRTYPMAVYSFDQAEAAGRKTLAVYANRAVAHLSTGPQPAAFADADKALKIDPNCKVARTCRAVANVAVLGARESNPPTKPLPRWVVNDIEAGMRESESRGSVLALVAEAHVWVENPTDADRERAVWAVNRSVRVGYKPNNFEMRKIFTAQLGAERLSAALHVTDDERLPQDTTRVELVLPEE